jgi:transcriptional regulator with XRE-family HTH domain
MKQMSSINNRIKKTIEHDFEMLRSARKADLVLQLKQIMVDKDVSVTDLCKRTGKSDSTIRRWLGGLDDLRITNLYLIADALEVSLKFTLADDSTKMVKPVLVTTRKFVHKRF